MKKLSPAKINYRKHERDMFARQSRRDIKKEIKEESNMEKELLPDLWFRNIIELSCMCNNDERVFYTRTEKEKEEVISKYKISSFDNPRIVMSRPVQPFEVLDVTFKGDKDDEKTTPITDFLDAFEEVKKTGEYYHFNKKHNKNYTISKALSNHIAMSYYDCMSGGCPITELALLRYLCLQPEIDKTTPVYPKTGRKEWTTIEEFIEETKDLKVQIPQELIEAVNIKGLLGKPKETP